MTKLHGTVVVKPYGAGTKSEHDAVMLVSDSGEYLLRRRMGNAFSDPELDKLVGREIVCSGEITGGTMIMSEWEVIA